MGGSVGGSVGGGCVGGVSGVGVVGGVPLAGAGVDSGLLAYGRLTGYIGKGAG